MIEPFDCTVEYLWKKILSDHQQDHAVYENERFYTYKELDDRSWAVADEILRLKDSVRIGVMLDSSYDYVCAVLGVLKAGKSFVPMDRDWPDDRLDNIIKKAEIKTLISSDFYDDTLTVINMDKITHNGFASDQKHEWKDADEAYVLHSSGTTGEPKGIIIKRNSLVNLSLWFGKIFLTEDINNILQLAKTTFDVSIEEIFGTILNGRTLFIPPHIVRKHKIKLRQFVEEKDINLIEVVPATLTEFFDREEKIKCLRTIICGADVLREELKNSIIELGYDLYNNYGPTETTVDAMYHKCCLTQPVQLGECVDGCEIAILTEDGELATDDCEGELLIAGVNLTPGYLKNDELNEQKFLYSPSGKRYYMTGDLVKTDDQGRVFFKGRSDHQVKIRGQRIEIEEIEKAFADEMKISLCAAVCIKEKAEKIVLFYESDEAIDHDRMINGMRKKLPEYMLPSDYQWLERLPKTENGKVDRNALSDYLKEIPQEIPKANLQEFDEDTVKLIKMIEEATGESSVDINETVELVGFDSLSYVRFLVEVECMWDVELGDELWVPDENETVETLIKKIKDIIAGV